MSKLPTKAKPQTFADLECEIASLKSTVEFQATTIRANDHAITQITKRADENIETARQWKKQAEEYEITINKSRKDFASIKEAMHRTEMALARLEGYRDHVREADDSKRLPITTTVTEPSTAPRMQRQEAMRGSMTTSLRTRGAYGEERHEDWVNY
jgi:uncharacterized protein (DUF2342 family)